MNKNIKFGNISTNVDWFYLPDSVLLDIFSYLNFSQIPQVSLVCKKWHRVSQDEFLWKRYFLQDFSIKKNKPLSPGKKSWIQEYKRLVNNIPIVECECLEEHNNQVLHVSFSNNGKMFATCSKDGFVVVWNSSHPASALYHKDMKVFSVKYTQFSQFNESDTLLLVSGVYFGGTSTSGEIAVFNLEQDFQLQCRVMNKPYDVFGTWFNDEYLLSGDLKWLGNMVSASILWLNKANQALESEREAIVSRMYQFYNQNAASMRNIMVADIDKMQKSVHGNPPSKPIMGNQDSVPDDDVEPDRYLIFTTGSKVCTPHQIGVKKVKDYKICKVIEAGPGIRERIEMREARRDMRNRGLLRRPDWMDFESVRDRFDVVDHLFEMEGHVIGMCLSPDHRYLYVNSRPWLRNASLDNPLRPPTIAQEIDIHVFDLVDFKEVGPLLRSHVAFTPSEECFFIFLDVTCDYVASGAENNHAYLWERHYETCAAKLPHKDVVNSVAFNPVDPEMLVTVSDDHKIKVWRSRRKASQLGVEISRKNTGTELRFKHAFRAGKDVLS